ncbi:MAG: PDZ domain-containing protein, partial [Clostridiales bacterium]|nr:PDZ domain-containing protein [Clostridiales bacterium]
AIPINDVRGVIDDLISYGYARGRIALGVTLINIENEQAAFSYRVEGPGVYVYRVENNSNAERAGLKQGDRLISVNGQEITDAGQVSSIIQKLSVGDKLNMTYKREGETHTVDIIMQETVPAEAPATKISNQP